MVGRVLLVLFAILIGLMLLAAYLVQTFGWLALVAVLGGAAVFGYVLARMLPWFLVKMMTAPFRRMGQVLDGAAVRVNAIEKTEAPADFEQDFESEYSDPPRRVPGQPKPKPFDWYWLDVTITPTSSQDSEPETVTEKIWQPDALNLVPVEAGKEKHEFFGGLASLAGGGLGIIVDKLIWDGFEFVPYDGDDVWGIQRLRLHIGLPQDMRRVAFLYQMFVRFGDIAVPGDRTLPRN